MTSGPSISTLEIHQERQPVGFIYSLSGPMLSTTTTTTTTAIFICIPIYIGFLYSTFAWKFRIDQAINSFTSLRSLMHYMLNYYLWAKDKQKQPLNKDVFKAQNMVQQLFVKVYNKQLRKILVRGLWGEPRGGSVLIKRRDLFLY